MENINFQPMPKRFMVWDKEAQGFVKGANGYILNWREIANLVEPTVWDCATELDKIAERFTVIQSTNLFDKDGKEIFEGSIIHTLMAKWLVKQDKGCMCAFNYRTGVVMPLYKIEMNATTNIGHILSNPELLEER